MNFTRHQQAAEDAQNVLNRAEVLQIRRCGEVYVRGRLVGAERHRMDGSGVFHTHACKETKRLLGRAALIRFRIREKALYGTVAKEPAA